MSHDATGQEMAAFGILDWESCAACYHMSPASDVIIHPEKFVNQAIWYMSLGLYKLYFTHVEADSRSMQKLEQVFQAQGNNPDGEKEVGHVRSLSASDIVILKDGTVWLCLGHGWRCLNPGGVF